jgi:hypothetical protein
MAIAFTAGTSVESTASQSSTTVTLPSGLASGDYTIIFISVNATNANITTPAGWTDILPDTNSVNGSTSMAHAIFYRKWVSGDTDPSISHSNGRVAATPVKVTGADPSTFVNNAATVTQAASGATTIVAPTITPSSTALVVSFAGRHATNGVFLSPWGSLSAGLTKIAEANGKATNATNAGHCIAYEIVSANTATGTRQANPANATTGAFGTSFALNVAASDQNFSASVDLAGAGTLTASNIKPDFIRTPDLSGFGTLAGVGVFGAPNTSFDDGTLQGWTPAVTASGTVQVLTAAKHDGTHGVRATAPTDSDAASISRSITSTGKARIAGWYRVTAEGLETTNVSFARFMNGSTILAGMYRQNVTTGPNIWLRTAKATTGFYFTSTGVRAALDEWVYIDFEWDQVTGTPTVKVNGNLVISTPATDWNAATTIDSIVIGAPETGKAGTWEADTLQINSYQAPVDLTGSGTLSVTATPAVSVSAALSGTGTLSATAIVTKLASAALSGAGTLSTTVTPAVTRTAALSGSGTLSTTRTMSASASANLTGDGALTAEQTAVTMSRTVNLSGTGTLSRVAISNFTATMNSSGVGTLTATVTAVSQAAAASFTGAGALTATQSGMSATSSAALSGAGTLTRAVTPGVNVNASLSGSGTLSTNIAGAATRTANLTGTGTLSVAVTAARNVTANLSGVGTLSVVVGGNKSASVNLAGAGTLQAFVTAADFQVNAGLSGSGSLSASAFQTRLSSGGFTGSGTLVVTASPATSAQAGFSGDGALTVDVTPGRYVQANFSGSGQLGHVIDNTQYNYEVYATLGPKRWVASIGLQRWKGSL